MNTHQMEQFRKRLKDQGMNDDQIDISLKMLEQRDQQQLQSQGPIDATGYSAPKPAQTPQTQPQSSAPTPRPAPSASFKPVSQARAQSSQTQSVQPQMEERNDVKDFFMSLFSVAPDVGQTIAGLASIPITAPIPGGGGLPGSPGILGTPGKVVRASIGALGRVGGEVLKQAGTNAINDIENLNNPNYVPSLMDKNVANQNLNDLRDQAVIGVGSEVVGEFLIGPAFEKFASPILGGLFKRGAGVANKALAPFKNQVNKEVVDLAAKKGVDLPVSAKTSSNFVKQTEAWVQKSFFGGGVTKKVIAAREAVEGLAKTITDELAKPLDKKSVGQIVKEGFGQFEESFTKTKTELYDAIPKAVYKAEAVTDSTKRLLQDIADRRGESLVPNEAGFFETLSEKLGAENLTFNNLKQTRTDILKKLANFNDPVATGNKADLKGLVSALSDDIEETVRRLDPDAYALLDQANSFYREGLSKVNSKIGQQIKNATPEKLLDTLLKPNSETDIALVKDILGDKGIRELQEGFTSKLYNDAVNNRTQLLDINKLRTQINKYGEASIKELLGEEGFVRLNQTVADLADIETLNKAINRGVKPAEGSQTAFLLNAIGTLQGTAAAFFFNPAAAIGGATIWTGGQLGLTKLVMSESGQKWLTEGLGELTKTSGAKLNQPIEEVVKRLSALTAASLGRSDDTVADQTSAYGYDDTNEQSFQGNPDQFSDNSLRQQQDSNSSGVVLDSAESFSIQNTPPNNFGGSLPPQTTQPQIPPPFNGMTKYEIMQMAIARGMTGTQLDLVEAEYERMNRIYKEAVGGAGNVDELLAKRKARVDAKVGTADIDAQLEALGVPLIAEDEEDQESVEVVTDLVDEILARDTDPLTGRLRLGQIDGLNQDAVTTKRKVEELLGKLQLAQAGKLKGQGQISNEERKMLANAATALNYNMSDKDFRAELIKIAKILDPAYSPTQD